MLSVGVHVNQLIKPAVALMNRLPMFYKFSLISVLFLLPIIALSWLVISELNRSVDTMTRGVEGLEQRKGGYAAGRVHGIPGFSCPRQDQG